jgi:hypothetical protein
MPFFATLKVKPGEPGSPYAYTPRVVSGLSGPSLNKHVSFSVARTGMLSWFDGTAQVVKYRHFAFDGDDFAGAPENVYVVKKITQRSGVNVTGAGAGPDLIQTFAYDESNGEYNTHLQLPQFPKCTLKQVAADGTDQGRTDLLYNLDTPSSKWYGRTLRLNGTLKERQTYNQAGNLLSVARSTFRTFAELTVPVDWPPTIPSVRLASTFAQDVRPNGSKMGVATTYSNYNNVNGQPQFTKIFQDDIWKVKQTLFGAKGQFLQSIDFAIPYAGYPGTGPNLETANAAVPFNTTNAVASSKVEYDPANPYFPLKNYMWRDAGTLPDDQVQTGAEPTFDLNRNWLLASEITRRNPELQVEETRFVKSGATGGESFTSTFYEGRKQASVASIQNAQWPNCAVIMGENADVAGLSSLDLDQRWSTSGVGYTTTVVHTGRSAFKVTDNYGPTTTLTLQNVRRDGFGYLVSAWIYRPAGSTGGGLTVERWNAAGTKLNTYTGSYIAEDPYDFSQTNGRWERWEVKLANADLIAGGLFNGANDYLRVWIGTGAPTGNGFKVLYVDDVVCRPSNSTFSLRTFDYKGNVSSMTDTRHVPSFPDVDYAGNVVGVRDERGRMFTESSANLIGEN